MTRCTHCGRLLKNPQPLSCPHCGAGADGAALDDEETLVSEAPGVSIEPAGPPSSPLKTLLGVGDSQATPLPLAPSGFPSTSRADALTLETSIEAEAMGVTLPPEPIPAIGQQLEQPAAPRSSRAPESMGFAPIAQPKERELGLVILWVGAALGLVAAVAVWVLL